MSSGPIETPAKPFIRWAGSKKQLVEKIAELAPTKFKRYIEPFTGSACVFFRLNPRRAILGDSNMELMATYRAISKNPRGVYQIFKSFGDPAKSYYKIRGESVHKRTETWKAARFLYLNRHCFNGIYRTNLNGDFNVPLGSRFGEFPSLKEFTKAAAALKRAKIVTGDFSGLLKLIKKGDFVYLDPPYASASKKDRNEYGNGSFKPKDIPRLFIFLKRIHKIGAKFLLSYSVADDFLEELPRPVKTFVKARRTVASDPKKRRVELEVLLRNQDIFRKR